MPRFLCVSWPGRQYLGWYGPLGTILELKRRGHTVAWFTGHEARAYLEALGIDCMADDFRWQAAGRFTTPETAGIPFSATGGRMFGKFLAEPRLKSYLAQVTATMVTSHIRANARRLLRAIREFRPHVVLAESSVVCAPVAAEAAGVPWLVIGGDGRPWTIYKYHHLPFDGVHHLPALEPAIRRFQRALSAARAPFGLPLERNLPVPGISSPYLEISLMYPGWDGEAGGSRRHVRFVGGSWQDHTGQAAPPTSYSQEGQRPSVLMVLGSAPPRDAPEILRLFSQATLHDGADVKVISPSPSFLVPGEAACEVKAVSHEEYWQLLSAAALAVHLGDSESTWACLAAGVPQLALPVEGEQFYNAWLIEANGLGMGLEHLETSPGRLREAVELLLEDTAVRQGAAETRERMRQAGGAARAADLVEEMAAL